MLKVILKSDSYVIVDSEKKKEPEKQTKTPENSPVQTKRNRPRLFSRDVNPNAVSCSPCSY